MNGFHGFKKRNSCNPWFVSLIPTPTGTFRLSHRERVASDIIARVTVANKARAIALLCCLIAFLLSAWALDARSLWGDEAFSVWASKQGALKLIAGLDAQPPLYHLALGAARALFGESVFAIRFISVACGVLLVAIGANIGRRIGGVYVSMLTALLLATSPILIYFMQEARMYTLAALMAGGAMLFTMIILPKLRGNHPSAVGCWLTYVAFSLAALFTHFYTAGILLANAIALGIAALRSRNGRRMAEWAIAHAAIAVIFLGWFIGLQSRYAVQSAQSRPRIVPLWEDIVNNIGRGINGLIFGMRAESGMTIFALLLFVGAVAGLLGYWRRGRRGAAALLFVCVASTRAGRRRMEFVAGLKHSAIDPWAVFAQRSHRRGSCVHSCACRHFATGGRQLAEEPL